MNIIEVDNLSKSFYVANNINFKSYFTNLFNKNEKKEIKAIDSISFNIELGESVAYLGTNGAGKSTTIKILTGILIPTIGTVRVFNKDPFKNRIFNNEKIAAVFGQRCQLRWDISAYESFKLLKSIYRIPQNDFNDRLQNYINMLNIEKFMHQPVRTLSLGQKMRVELCAAFLHDPKIIFLDEPTIGLDIFSKEAIINFLKDIKSKKQCTILLTTHDVSDVEQLCERTIIIEQGKVILDDKTNNIEKRTNIGNKIIITTNGFAPILPDSNFNAKLKIEGNTIIASNVNKAEIPIILQQLFAINEIVEVKVESPDFKDIIKKFYLQEREK